MSELPGFIGPSYQLTSRNVSCQRSVNLYPERDEVSKGRWSLKSRPSLTLLAAAGDGPCRGLRRCFNNRAFMVSGSELYEITNPTSPALLGTLNTARVTVSMAENANHLVIVDGTNGYAFNFTTNVLSQIADVNFPVASSIAFLDQYLLANDDESGRFQFSALNDATDWDGLDVATAEGSPDNLIALAVNNRQVILFGAISTEVWFDSGDSSNPFQRISGAFIEHGIAGEKLHASADNTEFFWSKDANGEAMAMRLVGYQAVRVSTFAIEQLVQQYGDISEGTCWAFQTGGHTFFVTNFPNANVSLVYDVAAGAWHEWSVVSDSGAEGRSRAQFHVYHSALHIVGDYENGNLYKMVEPRKNREYSENGSAIPRERTFPGAKIQGKRVFVSNIQIDAEMGVGLDGDGQGSDPLVTLQISKDGGNTFSNEMSERLGKIGETLNRINFSRLGAGRDWVFKLRCSEPVPLTLIAAWIEFTEGAN
jgi:hypothetical protein